VILNRITPLIDPQLSQDQAGFRCGRSTGDQVAALTTYIENGFQKGLKTGAVFLDLTAAYDTVWHTGLMAKLTNYLPHWAYRAVELLLRNRRFRVHMGDDVSAWRNQVNGLPQGSVLAPTLFCLYINDLPETKSRKFAYADDICNATQAQAFTDLEKTLTDDLALMSKFCKQWRLIPSVTKTVTSVFHLHNASAKQELNVSLNGNILKHDPCPTYLGVTLDRTLSYKEHLKRTAAKIQTRNNLLTKLAGSSWGAKADTLRTSALALCYSVGEYCCPTWSRSAHTSLVDVALNHTMRLISGTLRPTPTQWLPVLCNIVPPHLRRRAATSTLIGKALDKEDWGLHNDVLDHPDLRLKSRHPLWTEMESVDISTRWREEWQLAMVFNHDLVVDPAIRLPGFELPRREWSTLNRFRTGQGRCAACLKRWALTDSDLCACGSTQTMMHIVNDCSLSHLNGGMKSLHKADDIARQWLAQHCA